MNSDDLATYIAGVVAVYMVGAFWSYASFEEYRGLPHRIARQAPTRDAEKAVHILFGIFSPIFMAGALFYYLFKFARFLGGAFGVFWRGIRDLAPIGRKPKIPTAKVIK